MKKSLPILFLFIFCGNALMHAQLNDYYIDDFEGGEKNYFLPYGGYYKTVVDPLNADNKVLMYVRDGNEVYGGLFARAWDDNSIDSVFVGPNTDQYRYGVVRMLKTTLGPTRLKVEKGTGPGVENNPITNPWRVGEWQTFVFDFGVKNQDGKIPDGKYGLVALMPDRSAAQEDSIVTYIDDWYLSQSLPVISFTEQIVGGFQISNRTSSTMMLSWSQLSRALAFDIYVNDELVATRLSDELTYEFLDGDLKNDVVYTFKIIAKDGDDIETVPVEIEGTLRTKKNDWEMINDFEGPKQDYAVWKLTNLGNPVDNPYPDDVNPSAKVMQVKRPIGTGEEYPNGNSYGQVTSQQGYDVATIGYGSSSYHYMHVKMWRPITHGKPQMKVWVEEGGSATQLTVDSLIAMPDQDSIWFNYVFVLDSVGEAMKMVGYAFQPDNAYDDITTAEEARMYYIDDIILCRNEEQNTDISAKVMFNVTDGSNPIQGAAVTFNELYYGTDASGYIEFDDLGAGTYDYLVTMEGYFDVEGSIVVVDGDVTEDVVMEVDNTDIERLPAGISKIYTYGNILYVEIGSGIRATVDIIDITGRSVATCVSDQYMVAGKHSFPTRLDEGIYVIRVRSDNGVVCQKIFVD
jgi:hypothetical protein